MCNFSVFMYISLSQCVYFSTIPSKSSLLYSQLPSLPEGCLTKWPLEPKFMCNFSVFMSFSSSQVTSRYVKGILPLCHGRPNRGLMCGGINSLHVVSRSTQGGVVLRTALGGDGSNGSAYCRV